MNKILKYSRTEIQKKYLQGSQNLLPPHLLEFMVLSRNLLALRSQNSISPIPVPMVRMLPLKETDLMPHPEFRDGIFLTGCRVLLSNRSV